VKEYGEDNWRRIVQDRVVALDRRAVVEVRPFTEPTFDLGLLTRETLLRTLPDQ